MAADGWTKVKLADLCDSIDYGYTASASTLPVGPRFLRITDIVQGHIDWSSVPFCEVGADVQPKFKLYEGDVVIARTGATTGFSAFISRPPDAVFASYLIRLRIGTKADPRFVAYFLMSPRYWGYIHGVLGDKSAQPNASAKTLTQTTLLLPPLHEQRAIVHILGTLDDKIELNRRMNETLEAMARAIFKSWLVDFDPVRAKAQGRQPFGMDAETAALFPDSFQDFPLGKIPKGWKIAPLPEALHLNPPRSLAKGHEATYLDMQNMPTRGHRPVGWIQRPFVSGSRFTNGDTLIARITPCLENGKTAYVDFLKEGEVGWGSTEFIVLRPRDPLPPEYGYCLARDEDFRLHAIQNMTGSSGRQRVPTDCFAQYSVTVPSEPVARSFGQAVRPLLARVKANSEEAATLAALRDTLLPKLISGEIRLRDAEKSIEART